jgi:hypothetical protein
MIINAGCGAVYPELLQKVREQGSCRVALDGMPIAPSLFVNKDVSWTAIILWQCWPRSSASGALGEADGGGDCHEHLRVGAGYDESGYYSSADGRR